MKEFIEKITRPSRKWSDQVIIAVALSIIVGLVLGTIFAEALFKLTNISSVLEKFLKSDNLVAFFSDYLMFIGIWIAVFLAIVIFKYNRPMLKAWGYNKDWNNLKGALLGAALGFGTNGFCVLMSVLMGDIKLSYYGFKPAILLAFLVAVFIQSAAEEIVDRLYLYQKLRRRYKSPLVAILVNAIVFMALHVINPGFTAVAGSQILLVGIIFSVFVYYYNGLWIAMWFHALWNFTQNIIFGLPNSGIVSEYSIFKLEAASAESGFFYDVGFGVEGSIGASVVLVVVLIVLIVINKGKPEKRDYWAEASPVEKQ